MTLRDNSENFGLVAWLKATRVRLPLRAIDIRFDVTDTVADVHLDQVFTNERDESLDVTYTFPLPAASAVYRCEMIVDGRVTAAVVEEEGEARRQFVEAKAAGHNAALVEQHRDNVFSLQLGNVPAGAVVILRISYLQELERLVDSVSLRIPTCPGVRYIPGAPLLRSNQGRGVVDDTDQVPDASQISPPRIDSLHPDAAQISVRGQLVARDVAVSSILSPSHPLVARVKDDIISVSLALDAALPDQDVLIRWTPQVLAPNSVVTTTATYLDYHAGLSRLKGPHLNLERRESREVWFLVDRSGSMAGRNWDQSCAALQQALSCLHPADRVGISFFESSVQHFSDKLETVETLRRDPKLKTIAELGTTGGTEMLPALQEVLQRWKKFKSEVTDRHLVLITDGQVGNEDQILNLVKKFPVGLRVHPLGIDSAVNDAVLLKLATATNGRCVFIHPNDSIVEAVLAVVNAIEAPTVVELVVKSPWTVLGASPRTLSRQGETSALLATSLFGEVEWTGTVVSGGSWQPQVFQHHSRSPGVALLRVRREIAQLQAVGDRAGAVALAKRFNLLCEGACFIAIDRTTKTKVATHHIYEPALEEVACPAPMQTAAPSGKSFGGAELRKLSRGICSSQPSAGSLRAIPTFDSLLRPKKTRQKTLAESVPPSGTFIEWLTHLMRSVKRKETRDFLAAFLSLPNLSETDLTTNEGREISAAVSEILQELENAGVASRASLDALTDALKLLPASQLSPESVTELLRVAAGGNPSAAPTPVQKP